LAVVIGLGVAGCGDAEGVVSSGDLATASGNSSGLPSGADAGGETEAPLLPQVERAEAMATCLNDLSIPAILTDWPDGQAQVDFSPTEGAFAWVDSDGAGSSGPDTESTELFNTASEEGRTFLWIGGADRTEDYVRCAEETEYTKPGPFADPETERRVKQVQVDLNNDFAACARANGYPEIADVPPPVIDGGETSQSEPLLLPLTITEEGLRELLAACPPLDEERLRVMATGEDDSVLIATMIGPWIAADPSAGSDYDGQSPERTPWMALEAIISEVKTTLLEDFKERLAAEGIPYNGPEFSF
jgi:hypothetical protein